MYYLSYDNKIFFIFTILLKNKKKCKERKDLLDIIESNKNKK